MNSRQPSVINADHSAKAARARNSATGYPAHPVGVELFRLEAQPPKLAVKTQHAFLHRLNPTYLTLKRIYPTLWDFESVALGGETYSWFRPINALFDFGRTQAVVARSAPASPERSYDLVFEVKCSALTGWFV